MWADSVIDTKRCVTSGHWTEKGKQRKASQKNNTRRCNLLNVIYSWVISCRNLFWNFRTSWNYVLRAIWMLCVCWSVCWGRMAIWRKSQSLFSLAKKSCDSSPCRSIHSVQILFEQSLKVAGSDGGWWEGWEDGCSNKKCSRDANNLFLVCHHLLISDVAEMVGIQSRESLNKY